MADEHPRTPGHPLEGEQETARSSRMGSKRRAIEEELNVALPDDTGSDDVRSARGASRARGDDTVSGEPTARVRHDGEIEYADPETEEVFVILPEQLGDDIPIAETELVSAGDFPSEFVDEGPVAGSAIGGGPRLVNEVPRDPGEATRSAPTEVVDERQLDAMASDLDDDALAGEEFGIDDRSTEVGLEEEFAVDPDAYVAQADGAGRRRSARQDDARGIGADEFGFEEDDDPGAEGGGRTWARAVVALAAVAIVAVTAFAFFGPQIQSFFQAHQASAHGYGGSPGHGGLSSGAPGDLAPGSGADSRGGVVAGTQEVSVPPQFRERVVLALRLGYLGEVANE